MSIPNLLAIIRIALTLVVIALILSDQSWSQPVAAVLFVIAALTDFADGYLARRWKITTTLGAFLDTVADKVLVAGSLIALVAIGRTSAWAAFLIIGRELAVMGLRSVAALDQSQVPVSFWGKSKATVQFIAITLAILRPQIEIGPWYLDEWMMAIAVVVTLLSAGDYFKRFRAIFSSKRSKTT